MTPPSWLPRGGLCEVHSYFSRTYLYAHMKDAWCVPGDGTVGVFGGHTTFADPRRQWDFRSVG